MRRVYETETLNVEVPLLANARPPQPLNQRRVYVRNITDAFPSEKSRMSRNKWSPMTIILAFLVYMTRHFSTQIYLIL